MHVRMFGILILILLVSLGGMAAAHPPSRMQLTYQEQTGELEVDISHDVADPATHFVQEVVIRKNGVVLSEEKYTSQPSGDLFTYRYQVVLSPGDEVTAGADCNLFGSVTARLTIPGSIETAPPAPGTVPLWVYHALLLVTGFAFIIIAGLLPVYGKRIAGCTACTSALPLSEASLPSLRSAWCSGPPPWLPGRRPLPSMSCLGSSSSSRSLQRWSLPSYGTVPGQRRLLHGLHTSGLAGYLSCLSW